MLKEPGFVEARLLKWLTRAARVSAVETLTPHFRLVDLQGEALKDHVWAAGQKAQIQLGGFVSRTYTPMSWNNDKGATRFLAYIHGDGPASRWAGALAAGDEVLMFGPRGSLDLSSAQKPLVFFGDETSFGLAHSVAACGVGDASFLFEVTSVAESGTVLAALGIANATLVERKADDAHMNEVEGALMQTVEARKPRQFVLTGKSLSIQRLSKALKGRGFTSAQIKSKAYWAPGKTGLD
jgi:NADPH-dependent ferric siderophore reductase